MKQRLDKLMVQQKLAATRSEAESWIKLGRVRVNGKLVQKAGEFVADDATIKLDAPERYVSRAGLKLASVAKALNLDFKDKIVLDVGSSTGGFTDYALQQGAKKVIAVDVGTDQMHPKLRVDARKD
jgi:23S rRNA (cytidine1920-2'-O)/16S rRNA (cytidine1409-2'-O)-methyltransferase